MPRRGFALIAALFVAGLVAGVAALLVTRQQYLISSATGLKDSLRAERGADALESAAGLLLNPPATGAMVTSTAETLPDLRTPLRAEASGTLANGRLEALGGRFNLNSLAFVAGAQRQEGADPEEAAGGVAADQLRAAAESAGVQLEAGLRRPADNQRLPLLAQQIATARFVLLLRALGVDPALVPAVLDWLDPDNEVRAPNGAEDDYYSRLDPPYRAANRTFADTTELLRVRGVTPAIFERLKPYVTVLDSSTPVDLNSAPVEVLMSVAPGIDRPTAERLVRDREAKPWQSVMEFLANPALQSRPVLAQGLDVRSLFYALYATVEVGDLPVRFRSVLRRTSAREITRLERERLYVED